MKDAVRAVSEEAKKMCRIGNVTLARLLTPVSAAPIFSPQEKRPAYVEKPEEPSRRTVRADGMHAEPGK